MPHQARRGTSCPDARAISAAQIGWVATSAVDDATVVSSREGIQVPKCSASRAPAPSDSRSSRRFSRRSSARYRSSAHGAMAAVPKALRQNAMASAGAAVAAISGADVATAETATASSTRSRPGGRATALGAGGDAVTAAILAPGRQRSRAHARAEVRR